MLFDFRKHSFRFLPGTKISFVEGGEFCIQGGTGTCVYCRATLDSQGIHGANSDGNCQSAPGSTALERHLEQDGAHC